MTSQANPKTIDLYGDGCQHEAEALGAITPGMLIERAEGGVQAHGTDGGGGNLHFALEYGLTGRDIDDDYAAEDNVLFKTFLGGGGVYALLVDGQDVTEGDYLISNGDGKLAAQDASSTAVIVAQALESVEASGSDERIRVETVSPFSRTLA